MAGPGDRSSCNPRATRSQVSKAIVTRAWQAAVLGLFCFQPLGFYSMRLLWKLSGRDTQLGRADTWRRCAAFFFNLLSILVCCWFVLAPLSGLFGW